MSLNSVCAYCEFWDKDKSQELDNICFHNMKETTTQGFCSIKNRWNVDYDDTCDEFKPFA